MSDNNDNKPVERLSEESSDSAAVRAAMTNKIKEFHDKEKLLKKQYPSVTNQKTYNCSMGMSKILESISISATFKDDRRKAFDVIMLNALTVARNCYDKKLPDIEIVNNIKNDINTFMQYVQLYFMEQSELVEKPSVIVYLSDYNLPKVFLRESTKQRDLVRRYATTVFGKACQNPPVVRQLGESCTLYQLKAGIGGLPHQTLGRLIASKCDVGVIKQMQRRYLLVSHCPLDFHLQNFLKEKLYLLESYTGTMKSIQDFGMKVFKEEHVPFNQYTHLLLGDNVHIKPQIHRREKQLLLDTAKKNLWDKKPLAIVLNDIRRLNIMPIEVLSSIKF
jgi:hypothetical protein